MRGHSRILFQALPTMTFNIIILLLINSCSADNLIETNDKSERTYNNMMVVYPNIGNIFYWLNYNSLELERTTILDIPDSIGCFGICISANKDYIIFAGQLLNKPYRQYIISYDIKSGKISNIFYTGLDSVGAPRITAAYLPHEPGLIYMYSHSAGLYSINFLTKVINIISDEHGQNLGKNFYFSADKKKAAVLKQIGGNNTYSEIELYNTIDGVKNPYFVLNQNNMDSIQVDDLSFSEDNKKVYISIRVPQMRGIANYFGSYNLETGELYKSPFTFPWSINPYYMAYSSKRQEVYLVGEQNKFYIIDTKTKDYKLKDVIDLSGKLPGPSRLVLNPDENMCFVSCSRSNFIIAIDLDKKSILKKIPIEAPYLMLLLY